MSTRAFGALFALHLPKDSLSSTTHAAEHCVWWWWQEAGPHGTGESRSLSSAEALHSHGRFTETGRDARLNATRLHIIANFPRALWTQPSGKVACVCRIHACFLCACKRCRSQCVITRFLSGEPLYHHSNPYISPLHCAVFVPLCHMPVFMGHREG